ncbi:ABC transporter substrate-binding protein [Dactylosporangium sp. CA-233914]|uniref:ABC transporter substrate-binding protein n=1 Tax=Dactylosporangium sp. CA-233914 TaxID=3239934 RepID=UPI003D90B334
MKCHPGVTSSSHCAGRPRSVGQRGSRSGATDPSRGRAATRALARLLALLFLLSSCSDAPEPPERPRAGGTLHLLRTDHGIAHLDPQLDVVAEDAALAGGFLQRTLTAYQPAPDGGRLVPDLATDTGRPSADASAWTFTLRAGVSFEDGAPIGCDDVKYGVARAFATRELPGPRAAGVRLLDIPLDATGQPTYHGPYATQGNDVAAFDRAVTCSADQRSITFRLARPVGDFNGAVSQLAFSPVPRRADTGTGYEGHPVASGPYRIAENVPGERLVLVRNERWSRASDPYRPAYPDRIELDSGLSAATVTARLASDTGPASALADTGADADPGTDGPGRRIEGFQPFVRYLAIDTRKVARLGQRQAILAAVDRAAVNAAFGSPPGTEADGLISPSLGAAHEPTHLWDSLLGQRIGEHGDPAYARRLIERSGAPMPALTLDYDQAPANDPVARAIVDSLRRAGIEVTARPIGRAQYYRTISDPATAGELMLSAWGADWPSAATVIPQLLTMSGGHDLSRYDDRSFAADAATAAAEPDPAAAARAWARLNRTAMAQAVAIPLRFDRERRRVGIGIGDAYIWPAYGTLPYPALWIRA